MPAPTRALCVWLWILAPLALSGQVQSGEIRLSVNDAAGLALPASGTLSGIASGTVRSFQTDDSGRAVLRYLAPGLYRLTVEHSGFAAASAVVEVRSPVPAEVHLALGVSPVATALDVTDSAPLIDPRRAGAAYSPGTREIREQQSASPSRGLETLVAMQPGWIFESNAVLHPRGSEYQTLLVVDGVPMDENRSPGFAPGLETAEIAEMTVLTGNYPAEYGRKLGGIIEVVTAHDSQPGFRATGELGGGSFGSASGLFSGSYGWKRQAVSLSASGTRTDRYLDPPAIGNFTNTGETAGVSGDYAWDLSDSDRLHLVVDRRRAAFQVPNENVQQAAGQRQDRNAVQTLGQAAWTHVVSPQALLSLRGSVEDLSANLWSNGQATPVIAFQQRGFRRAYLSPTLAVHHGRHDFKFGADAYYAPVSEALEYRISDPSYFDPGIRPQFSFRDRRADREQSAFAQDTVRLGNLTLSAGLRWDNYRLVVAERAWSPRLGAAWYLPASGLVLRLSYDRVFLTPAVENLLLASSPETAGVDSQNLRLPVRPSRGNFWEAGFGKEIHHRARLDVSFYRRGFDHFADDDVFLNTGIGFPIAFQSARIRGIDAKLDLPDWNRFSGFASYSYMQGSAQLPVTGGLFLGDEAAGALGAAGSFPITQDQRQTARARLRFQATRRLWLAATAQYGSGLPAEITGDAADLALQYGPQIAARVNFATGRMRSNFSLDAGAGANLWRHEKHALNLELAAENLTNRLNVINFAGLFSGTGITAPRSASLRLQWNY